MPQRNGQTQSDPEGELRAAVLDLPVKTRRAMIDALASDPIVVGAYQDHDLGACPLLAAHRRGGRADCPSFARAWDVYCGDPEDARLATAAELRRLSLMLEVSLIGVEPRPVAEPQPAPEELPELERTPVRRTHRFRRRKRIHELQRALGLPARA